MLRIGELASRILGHLVRLCLQFLPTNVVLQRVKRHPSTQEINQFHQVEPDPWENLELKYAVGSRHTGRVRDLVPFGAFVELEDGIDGLVHISDLSWTKRVRHPGEVLHKGEDVEVIVLGFDRNERRIALGLKQAQTNPWDEFEQVYAAGTKTTGKVARVLEKGVVVELPRDVEGFVPNSQLKRITRGPRQVISVGDELQLEVIEFDKDSKKIILAAQAPAAEEAAAEPEDESYRQYVVGSDVDETPRQSAPPSEPSASPETPPEDASPPSEDAPETPSGV